MWILLPLVSSFFFSFSLLPSRSPSSSGWPRVQGSCDSTNIGIGAEIRLTLNFPTEDLLRRVFQSCSAGREKKKNTYFRAKNNNFNTLDHLVLAIVFFFISLFLLVSSLHPFFYLSLFLSLLQLQSPLPLPRHLSFFFAILVFLNALS